MEIINALKSKKGEAAYIYLCVLVLVLSMLLSVLILYMGLCAQVEMQKRDVQHKLDGYLSEVATEEFNSIKQGESYESCMDYEALEAGVCPALGFGETDTEYVYPGGNCTMIRPTVTVLKDDGFGVKVEYEAVFPILWNGKTYTDITIPVSVTGYYKMK